mmetsp:Transcript_18254/g.57529  ORF Transcript_18254/g.57529 Transcript_18254/m.57529 type:complete len:269 (-) Transcript_18254:118-924(-)
MVCNIEGRGSRPFGGERAVREGRGEEHHAQREGERDDGAHRQDRVSRVLGIVLPPRRAAAASTAVRRGWARRIARATRPSAREGGDGLGAVRVLGDEDGEAPRGKGGGDDLVERARVAQAPHLRRRGMRTPGCRQCQAAKHLLACDARVARDLGLGQLERLARLLLVLGRGRGRRLRGVGVAPGARQLKRGGGVAGVPRNGHAFCRGFGSRGDECATPTVDENGHLARARGGERPQEGRRVRREAKALHGGRRRLRAGGRRRGRHRYR